MCANGRIKTGKQCPKKRRKNASCVWFRDNLKPGDKLLHQLVTGPVRSTPPFEQKKKEAGMTALPLEIVGQKSG